MCKAFYSFILRVVGWTQENRLSPDIKKFLVVAAPHTSNWDFPLGVISRGIWQIDIKYLAKKELFVWPFGYLFRALGGYPVERSKSTNLVDQVVGYYNDNDEFIITITPEGTRKYAPKWKTGFWHIAKNAGVPVVPAIFDYEKKHLILDEPFPLTDDMEADIERLKAHFRPYKGKNPENGVR